MTSVYILGAIFVLILLLGSLHHIFKLIARKFNTSYKFVVTILVGSVVLLGSGVYQDVYHPCRGWFCIPIYTPIAFVLTFSYLVGPWFVRFSNRLRGVPADTLSTSSRKPMLAFLILFLLFNGLFFPSSTGGIKEMLKSAALPEFDVTEAQYLPLISNDEMRGIIINFTFAVPEKSNYKIELPRFILNSRSVNGDGSKECTVPIEIVASVKPGTVTEEDGTVVTSFEMEGGWFPQEFDVIELEPGNYQLKKEYLFVWIPRDTWAQPGTCELSIEPLWTVTAVGNVSEREIMYTSSSEDYERIPYGRSGTSVIYSVRTPILEIQFDEESSVPVRPSVNVGQAMGNPDYVPVESVAECEKLYPELSVDVYLASGPTVCSFWERELLFPALDTK